LLNNDKQVGIFNSFNSLRVFRFERQLSL
jgi:hypothetical protein